MPVTHAFVSAKSDGGDATLVNASDWNEAHAAPPWVVPLAGGRTTVTPPSGVTELDTAYRTVVDLTNVTEIHLVASVVDAASAGTALQFQTSPDQSAWTTRCEVDVDTVGLAVGYKGTVALGEVYGRLATFGGDNSNQLILGAITLREGGEDDPSAAPINYEGVGTAYSNSSAAPVFSAPTGVAEDDLLILMFNMLGTPTVTPAAGWTEFTLPGSVVEQKVYWKVAGPSEPSSYTWNFSGSTFVDAAILRFSGADNASPLDAIGSAWDTGSGTAVTATGITTGTAGALLAFVTAGGTRDFSSDGGVMTEVVDGNRVGFYVEELGSAGATGNRSFTISSSTTWMALLLAVKN